MPRLAIVHEWQTVDPIKIWEAIYNLIKEESLELNNIELNGYAISIESIKKNIISKKLLHWGVGGDKWDIDFGPIFSKKIDVTYVRITRKLNWDHWVATLAPCGDFIQAHVVDQDYDKWQNAKSPQQYTAANKPYEHLPMVHNGLPPPLDRMDIDISNNPGRFVLREGFIEAVASQMWISDAFCQKTGCHLDTVLSDSALQIERCGKIIKITSHDGLFVDETTANIQVMIRRKLYPNCIK